MATTLRAIFDGEVLRPEHPTDLEPNTTYIVTIHRAPVPPDPETEDEHPLTAIARLATDMGVTDLAERHDWYALRRLPVEPDGE